MATNPLRIKTSGGGSFLGLQIMSDTEMDYAVHQILTEFVGDNTSSGTLSITTDASGGGHTIGSFVDTYRTEAEGTHPSSNALATRSTYTFHQANAAVSEGSVTSTLHHDASAAGSVRVSNLTSNSTVAGEVIDTLVARAQANIAGGGIGAYKLQPSAPNSAWTAIRVINNTSLASGSNTQTTLWRHTDHSKTSAPSTIRPIKLDSTNVQELSDAEIKSLAAILRNRIIKSASTTGEGIGAYKLASSTPSGGTWAAMGSAFADTRNTLFDTQYTGQFTGQFTDQYTKTYEGEFGGTFDKQYE